jgi:hypothetical protein
MYRHSVSFFAGLIFIGICGALLAQESATVSSATQNAKMETRIAGAQYQAGGVHKFFFGAHYRDIWAKPVAVPILDLGSFAGGLTPLRKGGGQQTKSLRFMAADSSQYAFRSLDKDPSKALPPELRETVAASVIKDQISSAHPYAALVVDPLAEAVGVLRARPKLVILPDDERLGEFRQEFAGLLGFIEERPDERPDGSPGFAGSDKVVGTENLFEELAEDNDDYVDPEEFLKARLLDIYVGDWDRHVDQWRWARFKKDGRKIWHPIPRDRDQAFAKFDGLLPAMAEQRFIVRQFEGFNKKNPDVVSLTHSGRHLDRRFLNRLSREDFQEVAKEFAARLTDAVIENAVRQLPSSIYEINGEELTKKLQARREKLENFAARYYEHLAQYVEIVTSDKAEFAEVERVDNDHVAVRIFKRDKESGEKKDDLIYQRTFKRDETKEIRLFLLGGNDKVVVSGEVDKSILVRIIGGGDQDEIVDGSKVNGYFLSMIPFIPDAERKNFLYDVEGETQFVTGPSSVLKAGRVDSMINFHENTPVVRDYGYETKPFPFLASNPDDGFFLGGGVTFYRYGFRKRPYASKHSLRGNYAFKTGAFRLRYFEEFIAVLKGVDLSVEAHAAVPRQVRNFYGFGNDSPRDAGAERDDFYRVRSEEYIIKPALDFNLSSRTAFSIGGALKHFETVFRDDTTFARQTQPYGIDIHSLLELGASVTIDFRNLPVATTKGFYFDVGASHFLKVFDNDSSFTKSFFDGRLFFTPIRGATFALHAAGEKIWGTFPYYEAAYLGGRESLRGFRRERFAGDAALNGSAELQLFLLTSKNILFPTDVGLFFFADAGRVWVDGESPGDWHSTTGAGLWLAPIYRIFTFSIGAGQSAEGTRITAGGGFAF